MKILRNALLLLALMLPGLSFAAAATPSANGASLTGPTATGSLIDSLGNAWTLSGGLVYENGSTTPSGSVILVEYCGGVIYQENASKQWYGWGTTAWTVNPGSTTAPTTCGATAVVTNGTATLTWTAPTTDVNGNPLATTSGDALTGFNVYEGIGSAALAKVGSTAATVLTYAVTGLTVGSYKFAVTAVNAAGESAESTSASASVVQAAPVAAAPGAPASLSVTVTVTVP